VELTIEKLIYGGDGLARMPADESGRSKTIFIPFVLEGEQVSAQMLEQKPAFSRARPIEILSPSSERIVPGCRHFGTCGGCHYQHTRYEHQLRVKEFIFRETLRRTARIEWNGEIGVHSGEPWHYRNRTRLHVRHEPFAIGYYQHNSHELMAIKECPISSPLINRVITGLIELGKSGVIPPRVREIELFANAEDSALLLEVLIDVEGQPIEQAALDVFTSAISELVPQLQGVCGFATGTDIFPWSKLVWCSGARSLEYRVGDRGYRVQAGSFFQVNRFLASKLVELVTAGESGETALDLYAGTGLFSVPLAEKFTRVWAVESARTSYEDLLSNRRPNIEASSLTTEQFLRKKPNANKPDLVVLDPPRSGLGPKVTSSLLGTGAERATYVSCDPATLARDLRVFVDAGYKIASINLVDLFPQTYHLETVVKLRRN
jgi:23S rRNA (uracil1939-C5)-methyltransferase